VEIAYTPLETKVLMEIMEHLINIHNNTTQIDPLAIVTFRQQSAK